MTHGTLRPLKSFTYHFGFHTAVAVYHWLTGLETTNSVIAVGQIMNGLAMLSLYPLAMRANGRSRWAGVMAVLVAGLLSPMPMYYVNWGRYVQLAGQVILPIAAWLTLEMLESRERRLGLWLLTAMLVAGLLLAHYRVTIFYLLFLLVAWTTSTFWAWRQKTPLYTPLLRTASLSLLSLVLVVPWLWRLWTGYLPTILGEFARSEASTSTVAEQSGTMMQATSYVPLPLLVAAGLGVLLALARRERWILPLIAWVILLFLAANPHWLGLPGMATVSNFAGVLNTFTVLIGLYMPISILCGYLGSTLIEAIPDRLAWLRVAATVAAILVLSVMGGRKALTIVDTKHVLVTAPDLQAMEWIESHTPETAKFLANSFFAYEDNVIVGSDAGWWLPLLAHRENTVPPITYGHETATEPEYIARVNELGRFVGDNALDVPQTLEMLRSNRISHVYIGSQGGNLSLEELQASDVYSLVYHKDRVWILQSPVTRRFPDRESLIALGIILVAVLLRVSALAKQPLWYDELISISIATYRGGLATIWDARFYPHPPLFVTLLHFLLKGFAPSEYTARILPLFSSILAFPLFYRYTADVLNRRMALFGIFLLAFSPFHIYYSQEARPYSLMFTLVVLTLWVLHRALKTNRAGWWVAHAVCTLLLLYLHFFSWLFLGGEILYLLLHWRKYRHSLVPYALSLLVVPLAIPPLLHLVRDSKSAGQVLVLNAGPNSITLSSTWMTLAAGETRYVSQVLRLIGGLVFGLLAVLGSVRLWRYKPEMMVLVCSMLAVPVAFVFAFLPLIGYTVPPYEERQFAMVLPFVLMLVASGLEYLHLSLRSRVPRPASTGVLAAVVALLLVGSSVALASYYTTFEKNFDIHVLEYLESHVQEGDIIVCNSPSISMNVRYHWQADIPLDFVSWPLYREGEWWFSRELLNLPEEPLEWTVTLEEVLSSPRVWLVTQDGFGTSQLASQMLEQLPPYSADELGPFSILLFAP